MKRHHYAAFTICGNATDGLVTEEGLCPKKGVWNFQALETPAFIGLGEFQTRMALPLSPFELTATYATTPVAYRTIRRHSVGS